MFSGQGKSRSCFVLSADSGDARVWRKNKSKKQSEMVTESAKTIDRVSADEAVSRERSCLHQTFLESRPFLVHTLLLVPLSLNFFLSSSLTRPFNYLTLFISSLTSSLSRQKISHFSSLPFILLGPLLSCIRAYVLSSQ